MGEGGPWRTSISREPRYPALKQLELPDQPAMKKNQNKGRSYAWGHKDDPDKCNYNKTGIGITSTPGCFSRGASPYSCQDMNGNVREWQRNKRYPPYPYPLKDQSWDDPEGKSPVFFAAVRFAVSIASSAARTATTAFQTSVTSAAVFVLLRSLYPDRSEAEWKG